jgi:hypothetical protein
MFGATEENTYNISITKSTAKALVRNILNDSCPNKDLMSQLIVDALISNSFSDFINLFNDKIPEPLFSVGDRVRIKKSAASLYDVDYEQTKTAGYMLGEGIYCIVKSVSPYRKDPYVAVVSYISQAGKEEFRERSFSDTDVMIDNTIVLNTSTSNVAKVL